MLVPFLLHTINILFWPIHLEERKERVGRRGKKGVPQGNAFCTWRVLPSSPRQSWRLPVRGLGDTHCLLHHHAQGYFSEKALMYWEKPTCFVANLGLILDVALASCVNLGTSLTLSFESLFCMNHSHRIALWECYVVLNLVLACG